MSTTTKIFCIAAIFATFATPSLAQVAGFNDAGSYNSGYGMNAGSAQQPVKATGVQNLRNLGQNSGVGFGNSSNGTASAIGNSLNVITTGSYNTVIVNSKQTNNGNQTATVTTTGH